MDRDADEPKPKRRASSRAFPFKRKILARGNAMIASKTQLEFKKLTSEEMSRRFISPQQALVEAFKLDPTKNLIISNSMGHLRAATSPAFTVTSSAGAFGQHAKAMTRIPPTLLFF